MSLGSSIVSASVLETRDAGRRFGAQLAGTETVLLFGDLGSGKTVFAQGVASALGIDPGEVQSPTYTLIHEYPSKHGREPVLIHIDLYRLSPDAVESTGLDEVLAGPGVKLVEWADRLGWRPDDAWMITLEQIGSDGRRITIQRDGD